MATESEQNWLSLQSLVSYRITKNYEDKSNSQANGRQESELSLLDLFNFFPVLNIVGCIFQLLCLK